MNTNLSCYSDSSNRVYVKWIPFHYDIKRRIISFHTSDCTYLQCCSAVNPNEQPHPKHLCGITFLLRFDIIENFICLISIF